MIPDPPTPPGSAAGRPRAARVWLSGLWLALLAQPAAAALSWDALVIERVAALGAPSEDFTFHFRNSGNAPVTITYIQTSCGCTTAALAKQVFAPGESGDLKVTYRFGGQVGQQEKTVSVTTSDAPDVPTVLVARVTIPELYTISPRLLWWSIGDAPVEKQAAISINPALKGVVTLEPLDETGVGARLVARPGGHDYVLSIQPASTKAVLRARVDLRIEPAGFPPQVVSVYALVR